MIPGADLGNAARVLFVDDEPRILTTMRMLFRGRYELLFANSGAEALEILSSKPVEVIVSDQRMPQMTGIEFLREARRIDESSMRILLTGYSDLKAIIDSINEGEIFRYVQKPWDNQRFIATVEQAVKAAQVSRAAVREAARQPVDSVANQQGVLVLDDDGHTASVIRMVMGDEVKVAAASSLPSALDSLERDQIAVVVSETRVQGGSVVEVLKALKQHRPELISVVLTDRADAHTAIALINEGQVYRMIAKPIHESQCRIALRSALRHHERLSRHKSLHQRYAVAEEPAAREAPQVMPVNEGLLERIRRMRESIHRPE